MVAGIVIAVLVLLVVALAFILLILLCLCIALGKWGRDKTGQMPLEGEESEKYIDYALGVVFPFTRKN